MTIGRFLGEYMNSEIVLKLGFFHYFKRLRIWFFCIGFLSPQALLSVLAENVFDIEISLTVLLVTLFTVSLPISLIILRIYNKLTIYRFEWTLKDNFLINKNLKEPIDLSKVTWLAKGIKVPDEYINSKIGVISPDLLMKTYDNAFIFGVNNDLRLIFIVPYYLVSEKYIITGDKMAQQLNSILKGYYEKPEFENCSLHVHPNKMSSSTNKIISKSVYDSFIYRNN